MYTMHARFEFFFSLLYLFLIFFSLVVYLQMHTRSFLAFTWLYHSHFFLITEFRQVIITCTLMLLSVLPQTHRLIDLRSTYCRYFIDM
jgi:hypothetical protein